MSKTSLFFAVTLLLGSLVLSSCGRDKMIRVRMLSAIADKTASTSQVGYKGTDSVETDHKTPLSSGSSLYFVFQGLGLGTSSTTTRFESSIHLDNNSTPLVTEVGTLKASFTEMAFSFGNEAFTTMWGIGQVASGSFGVDVNYDSNFSASADETLSSPTVKGSSSFVMFGHNSGSFETLLGMRWNTLKIKLNLDGTAAKTLKAADSISISDVPVEIKTVQTMIGIGFSF